jgi:hypothetical protein
MFEIGVLFSLTMQLIQSVASCICSSVQCTVQITSIFSCILSLFSNFQFEIKIALKLHGMLHYICIRLPAGLCTLSILCVILA